MAQIYMKYNPYRMETQIDVNGKRIENDSTLFKVVKGFLNLRIQITNVCRSGLVISPKCLWKN